MKPFRTFAPLTWVIAAWLFGCAFCVNAQAPAAAAADPLEASAREVVRLLSEKQFDQIVPKLAPEAAKIMTAPQLAKVWDQIQTIYGTLRSQGAARQEKADKYRAIFVLCTFERGPLEAKIVFDDKGQVAGLFFNPPKVADDALPPATISEVPISVGVGADALPGTLSLPKSAAPWPAVVLVHGSGPADRDETVGAEKPFRDLAWGLAERGIAVLRYDKRTFAQRDRMAGMLGKLTIDVEATDDAVAATGVLRKMTTIDPGKIFVVGHSLGAMLAPRIAKRAGGIAGIALLAPGASPLNRMVVVQSQYIAGLDGSIDAKEQAQLDQLKAQSAAVDKLMQDGKAENDSPLLGAPAAYWLSMRGFDPCADAAALGLPILLLHGGRDYQVTASEIEPWRAALKGLPNATIKEYPSLNHLFIAGEGPSSPAEYQKPGKVDAQVVADLADWIKSRPVAAKSETAK